MQKKAGERHRREHNPGRMQDRVPAEIHFK